MEESSRFPPAVPDLSRRDPGRIASRPVLPSRSPATLDQDAVADIVALAAASCGTQHVLLVLPAASAPARPVHRFVIGDGRPPPEPELLLRLHRERDASAGPLLLEPLGAEAGAWSGYGYIGVTLHGADGAPCGVLCALRPPADGRSGGRPEGESGFPPAAVAAMQALARQATARLVVAHLLQSQSELLGALAVHMSQLAWLTDASGELLWCNRAFRTRFGAGATEDGLAGATATGLAPPDLSVEPVDDAAVRNAFLARWRDAVDRDSPLPAHTLDGLCHWFATTIHPLSQAGQPDAVEPARWGKLGTAIEVTAQMEAEPRQAPVAGPPDGDQGATPPAAAPAEGARILVVDDEPVVRMLVVDLLRERGHQVQEAEDAFIALARLEDDEVFDLMVTDIGLPGGFDGSTLARRARRLRPTLPILFITGYAFGVNGDVTLEPGIPVLTKPFTLTALSAMIVDLLAAAHA